MTRKRTFRRLDPALVQAASTWADAMGPYARELTPEAADEAASGYLIDHAATPIDDARAVYRAEAAHRTNRLAQAVAS